MNAAPTFASGLGGQDVFMAGVQSKGRYRVDARGIVNMGGPKSDAWVRFGERAEMGLSTVLCKHHVMRFEHHLCRGPFTFAEEMLLAMHVY